MVKKYAKSAIITIIIALSFILVLTRVDKLIDLKGKQIKNMAIDACSQNSRYIYESTASGVRTEETIKSGYESCLKAKGY